MEILNSFLGQALIAQIGEIVLFANTVTMAMPTRWRKNMMMDYISKMLNYLAMNIGKNRNMEGHLCSPLSMTNYKVTWIMIIQSW